MRGSSLGVLCRCFKQRRSFVGRTEKIWILVGKAGSRVSASRILTTVPLYKICEQRFVFGREGVVERPFKGVAVGQGDTELLTQAKQIATGIAVAFRKLVHELFNA